MTEGEESCCSSVPLYPWTVSILIILGLLQKTQGDLGDEAGTKASLPPGFPSDFPRTTLASSMKGGVLATQGWTKEKDSVSLKKGPRVRFTVSQKLKCHTGL